MKKTLKLSILAIAGILGLASFVSTPTYADTTGSTGYVDVCNQDVPQSVKDSAGCPNNSNPELPTVIVNIVNIIIGASGLVAIVFVLIGGVQYMTSTGDPGKLKKAKDTILYALIGMVICVLAFAITNWAVGVINDASDDNANNSGTTNTTTNNTNSGANTNTPQAQ